MTPSLQNLIRLLALYRDRLDHDTNVNAAALLRSLIAEIEAAARDAAPPQS